MTHAVHDLPSWRVQEAELAEAEQALAANQLCGTRLLDSQHLLAELAAAAQQQAQQSQQHQLHAHAAAAAAAAASL